MAGVRVSLVVLLVVSAGCAGFGPDARQPSSPDADGPPGVVDGAVNATALVAAHERSLRGRPVAVETTRARWDTVRGTNRTVTTRTVTDGNGTVWQTRVTESPDDRSEVQWWYDGAVSLRHDRSTGRTIAVDGIGTAGERYRTESLRRWLATGAFEVRTADASGRYVLSTTTYTSPDGEPIEADTVRYEARAVVTERGRVLVMSATLTTVERNKWGRQVRSRTFGYRLTEVGGLEPTEPGWAEEVADG